MIFLLATTDLSTDRRMQRICNSLEIAGYSPTLIGRILPKSLRLPVFNFKTIRIKCKIHRSFFFYIEFNIRSFFLLIQKRKDFQIICAADLDTLLAGYLAAKLLNKKLVFDAHEWYCQTPELTNRPFAKQIWHWIESSIMPEIKYGYTVCDSIANIYEHQYGLRLQTIRNMPEKSESTLQVADVPARYLIYIGAVNKGRGLEQIIQAMNYIELNLVICGIGDLFFEMKQLASHLGVSDKIWFMGQVPASELHHLCSKAFAGFLLLETSSQSYYYSLANKFFDYVSAGIPQIVSELPEYKKLIAQYQVGIFCDLNPNNIANAVSALLDNPDYYARLSANARVASLEWNWEKESEKLLFFYKNILKI